MLVLAPLQVSLAKSELWGIGWAEVDPKRDLMREPDGPGGTIVPHKVV